MSFMRELKYKEALLASRIGPKSVFYVVHSVIRSFSCMPYSELMYLKVSVRCQRIKVLV